MGDTKEYISHPETGGSINISEEVVAVLAATTLLDVPGAHVPGCVRSSNGAPSIDRKRLAKAVKLTFDAEKPDSVIITCNVYVNYGSVIMDVARCVQAAVKEHVEAVTGLDVTKVNVNVFGISFAK